jgi:hypothetical protein
MQNPVTDEWAKDLYRRSDWSEILETEPWRGASPEPWECAAPALREVFRARARRMLAGDLSVLPWTWPIGTKPVS